LRAHDNLSCSGAPPRFAQCGTAGRARRSRRVEVESARGPCVVNTTSLIRAGDMPCAASSTIRARCHVTTDPDERRTIPNSAIALLVADCATLHPGRRHQACPLSSGRREREIRWRGPRGCVNPGNVAWCSTSSIGSGPLHVPGFCAPSGSSDIARESSAAGSPVPGECASAHARVDRGS
jgi:hypothetical protein